MKLIPLILTEMMTEDFAIQMATLTALFFIFTAQSFLRKLWAFTLLTLIIGFYLTNIGYELYLSFLWLVELAFIIVVLLVIMAFNSSLKNYTKGTLSATIKNNLIFFIAVPLFFFLFPILLYYTNSYFWQKGLEFTDLKSNKFFSDYYEENQLGSIALSDLKGLGFNLYNEHWLTILIFLTFLTIASVLVVFIQLLISFKKNLNDKRFFSLKFKERLRYKRNKEFINKEILEQQLRNKNSLRIAKNPRDEEYYENLKKKIKKNNELINMQTSTLENNDKKKDDK